MWGGEGIRAVTDLGCRGIRRKKTKSRDRAETQSEDRAATVLLPGGTAVIWPHRRLVQQDQCPWKGEETTYPVSSCCSGDSH